MQIERVYVPARRTQLVVAACSVLQDSFRSLQFICFTGARSFWKSLRRSELTGAQTEPPPAGSWMLPPPPRVWPSLLLAGTCPRTIAERSTSCVLIAALFDQGLTVFGVASGVRLEVERLVCIPFNHFFQWFCFQGGSINSFKRNGSDTLLSVRAFFL